ncbi:MAG: pitrilysin family protein [Candidatus Omnitrophota bacterium]
MKEDHAHPVATALLTVGAGLSAESVYAGSGISHFVEHMVFKGSSKRDANQIRQEVKSYGGEINGSTGLDSANYYITIPKENLKSALLLLEDIVFHPALDPKEIQNESEVILKEIRLNQDDPSRKIMRRLWETSFFEHPYKLPVIGYEELFKKLTAKDLHKYHSLRYNANNTILTVVGDIEKDEILAEIKKIFGPGIRQGNSIITLPVEPEQNSTRQSADFEEINLGYMAIGYHSVEASAKDLYSLDVLAIILGSWDGSRLNKSLVKEKQLLYTVSSYNYTPKYPGLFIVYGIGAPEKLDLAKKQILEEVENIAESGVSDEELNTAKRQVIASYISSLETTSGQAGALSQSKFLTGDARFSEKYVKEIGKIDNTSLVRVAKKYLNPNAMTASILYPRSFAENVSPDKVFSSEALLPEKHVLSNGIRVILKEDHRLPKISIVSAFLGGLRAETEENNGISNLTSSMLLKGTKNRKEAQIREVIENSGGTISSFSGNNTFGVSLELLTETKNNALDVLHDVIVNPIFPEEEIVKQKEKIIASIQAESDDIYSEGFLKLRKELFGSYPYSMRTLGKKTTLENLTRRDIQKFHKTFCTSQNMVLSIVGDFESQTMLKRLEDLFSDVNKNALDFKWQAFRPSSGIKKEMFEMPKEQSLATIGFIGTTLKNSDRNCLDVLSSILSGEDGRLFSSIRDTQGMSYALGSFSQPGVDTGFFAAFAATDAEHLEKVKNVLLEEFKRIRSGKISEEEVQLSKTSLIGGQRIQLQSFGAFAYQMALDEIYGLGFDYYRDYANRISLIGREDIIKTVKKYIDFNNFAAVTVLGSSGDN